MAHRHEWLHEQVNDWVKDGLLDQSMAEQITDRYPLSASGSWLRHAITAFGAVIFGLGVILAFAYNWEAMPKLLKLAVIFGGIAVAHGLAMRFGRESSGHGNTTGAASFFRSTIPNLAEGFHLLGSMLFGAGIFLVAQIYHLDEHFPMAFLIWGVGALVLAWLLPSNFQALLALVPLAIWGGSERFVFDHVFWPAPLLLFVGLVVFAWIRQSAFLFAVSLATTLWLFISNVLFIVDYDYLLPLIYLLGIVLIVVSLMTSRASFYAGSNLLFKFGSLIYGGLLFYLSSSGEFERYLYSGIPDTAPGIYYGLYVTPVLLSAVIVAFLVSRHLRAPIESGKPEAALYLIAQCILLLISSAIILFYGTGNVWLTPKWLPWIYSIILFVHGVLMIIQGNILNRRTLLLYGSIVVLLVTTSRFLDLFHSLLARSLVFLFVGGLLFYIGHRLSRMSSGALEENNPGRAATNQLSETENA